MQNDDTEYMLRYNITLGTALIALENDWKKEKAAIACRELLTTDGLTAATIFAENLELREKVKKYFGQIQKMSETIQELEKAASLHEAVD